MDSNPSSRVWTFAGCVLDERSLELEVGGEAAHLNRKPLEVLLHLLRHAGEVVTKDELAEAVWPGRIITDSNLTKTVAVLRAALGEAGQAAIKTVHGYGYRLVAQVSVQMPASDPGPSRIELKAGDSPPLRPQWRLETRLGAGGQGEAWLARHAGTGEGRVFKFAAGGRALTALKREITLNRLLRETLPQRNDYLRLIDWNLDEPPCFVESEFVAGGNLAAWAESQGGLGAVALELRLELLAQVAEIVAAAHSVGVLHKDIKPGNVLVAGEQGHPRIVLADFGSGGVVDPAAIDAYGITRMGFTQTVRSDKDTSGTPLYLAPEVFAGQPFTVQSDVYALGVMLYQVAAGDLRKALAPGWEKDVPDALLREDIALAAAGDPADRLGDAAAFAQRVRSLAQRRQQRQRDEAIRARAEHASRLRKEVRRLRAIAAVLVLAVGGTLFAGAFALRARDEVRRALGVAQAVSDFVTQDMLGSVDPNKRSQANLTVKEMVDAAAAQVDLRFADRPEVAAELHHAFGNAYAYTGGDAMLVEQTKAAALFEQTLGRDHPKTLRALFKVAVWEKDSGDRKRARAIQQDVLSRRTRVLGATRPEVFASRMELAALDYYDGDWMGAAAAMRQIVAEMSRALDPVDDTLRLGQFTLGRLLMILGDYEESEGVLRALRASLQAEPAESHLLGVRTSIRLGEVMLERGRLAEAERLLAEAASDGAERVGAESGYRELAAFHSASLRMQRGDPAGAVELLEPLARELRAAGGLQREEFRALFHALGDAYLMAGRGSEAVALWEEIVRAEPPRIGLHHPLTVRHRLGLAEALLGTGRRADARAALASITVEALAALPERHPYRGDRMHLEGLLLQGEAKPVEARAALAAAVALFEHRLGEHHWRTRQAKAALISSEST